MQTRSTSSIEPRRRIALALVLALFAVLPHCSKDEPSPVAQTECRPNQFRLCDAECGRGVEQCVEPGVWSACACTVLDAGRPDARVDRDASDAGLTDARLEAADGEAGDSPIDSDSDAGSDAADSGDPDSQPD